MKTRAIAFFKPYEVLCQFTDTRGRKTLKDYINTPGIYAAGRLDYRSEGLLILSDEGGLIHRLTDPYYEHPKTYFVQVEGIVSPEAITALNHSILLPEVQVKPVQAEIIPEPELPARSRPVRPYHPTTWLKMILREGKKHQVRRLTAAVGFPTLRLVRYAIGNVTLGKLQPGEWRPLTSAETRGFLSNSG